MRECDVAHTRDGQHAERSQEAAKQQEWSRGLWYGLGLADRVSVAATVYVSAFRQENPIRELRTTGATEVKVECQRVPCVQGRQSATADYANGARDRPITATSSDAVTRLSDVHGVDIRIVEGRAVQSHREVAESRSDIVLVPE